MYHRKAEGGTIPAHDVRLVLLETHIVVHSIVCQIKYFLCKLAWKLALISTHQLKWNQAFLTLGRGTTHPAQRGRSQLQ